MLAAGGVAGAGALGGGIASGLFARSIAREQMGFQARMSNTSYQRMMGDLGAAGLNPLLVAKLGGASTPPGAAVPAAFGDLGVGNAVNSALRARELSERLKGIRNTNRLVGAQATAAEAKVPTAQLEEEVKREAIKKGRGIWDEGPMKWLERQYDEWFNRQMLGPPSKGPKPQLEKRK